MGEPDRLRDMTDSPRWLRRLGGAGLLFVAGIVALTLFSRSPLWFLGYPLLICGALAALTSAVALLIRHF